MTWQYYTKTNSIMMQHPCDGLGYKNFDAMLPNFAEDLRNISLGLCSEEFTLNILASEMPYSYCPVEGGVNGGEMRS
jgi:hypothetical protein